MRRRRRCEPRSAGVSTIGLGSSDPRAAGVTTAVLIGDRSGLTPDDERRLQDAGTYHVIAISGGNIAILAVLSTLLARLLFVRPSPASIVTALLLVFYGAVASGAASVARAVTVAVLVLHGAGARPSCARDQRAGDRRAARGRGRPSRGARSRFPSVVRRHARHSAGRAADHSAVEIRCPAGSRAGAGSRWR